MKVLLSWIKEYLAIDLPPEELAHAMTLAGLESEGIEEIDSDVVFEIGLTPNLGHCMSVLGIARELSAILEIPLKRKEIRFSETSQKNAAQIFIEDQNACHQYACRIVSDVKVEPSPKWLQSRLEMSGIRSINNLVDIGNYVMLELGQPLHLFDHAKLKSQELHIGYGNPEDVLLTLDDQERLIPSDALLIKDGKRPIAFAGVMGGLESSVSDSTQTVFIEAAHFSPESVRKTSKLLNLRTDSSQRFERGIDPLNIQSALDYAAQLLVEVAGGKVQGAAVEATSKPYTPSKVKLRSEKANSLLGTRLSPSEMSLLLQRLEIETLSEKEGVLELRIPSYRNDLKAEIDLIEEVGRMYGFNHIPRKVPRHASSTMSHAPLYVFEEEIREKLVSHGLQECLTCDLISPQLAEMTQESSMPKEAQIRVLHPASVDQSVLRTTLLPGLLEMIKYNQDRQNTSIAAFEVGHIHFKDQENHYGEPAAGIILTGKRAPYHFETKPEEVDFFTLKGHVEDLLASIGASRRFEPSHLHNFHPGRQARILAGQEEVGVLGEVHPKHLRTLGINQRVYYAELNLHDLMHIKRKEFKVRAIPHFPGSERDWTISTRQNVQIGPILKEIKTMDSEILENVFLLDIYKSEKLGPDKMNITLRFRYRDLAKTVEYDEVEKEHARITEHIAEKLKDSVV